MHRRLLLLVSFSAITLLSFAQKQVRLSGKVVDSSGAVVHGATIKAYWASDSTGGVTASNGTFTLYLPTKSSFILQISGIGYSLYEKKYRDPAPIIDAGVITLAHVATLLSEVTVTSENPITVKEDTIEYKASAYKVRDGAPVEDVIKKLPGVTVDKDGQVTAQGKQVSRVRVNGKDFFSGDVQTATRNLPADIIDNIQIIDDYGDQANLTGIKSGDPEKIININVRKDRNRGNFGYGTAAAGNEGRFAGGAMLNHFNNEQQVSIIGDINNTNTNLFNFNGGGRGGGARGANFGSTERGGNGGNGINLAQSLGLNYRDSWGKKVSVYGSYSFSARHSNITTTLLQQDIDPNNIRFTSQTSQSHTSGNNHRATFNLEYRVDSANYLKFSPYVSFSTSNSERQSQSAITRQDYFTNRISESSGKSSAPNAGTDITFNHKFKKRGRNFNFFTSITYSYRNQDQESMNNYANDDSTMIPLLHTDTTQKQHLDITNRNLRTVARLSYTEPLTTNTFLELNYEWNRSANNNEKGVNDIDPFSGTSTYNPVQSNHFNYQFITNRIGINIKGNGAKYNYVIGIVSQPSMLDGQSIGKAINTSYRNTNWLPSARFVYNFARSHSLTLTYGGSSREPDFMQLQPVSDSSNLNNIVVGNPNLQAELTRRLSLQYNKFDNKSGRSLFTNLSFDQTDNKIVSSRTNNVSGTGRTTSYLNTNGFYSLNANGSFTQPFSNRKFSATVSINGSYDNNVSYTDNNRNKGQNWNIRPSGRFRVDIEDIVDLSTDISYTIYQTTTRYAAFTNTTKARTLTLGISGRNYFFKDLTLGYDFSKNINYGFSSNVSTNPVILSLYTEYRFLKNKRATVKLQGFDLFNQNTGISRTVSETTITDSRSNRLARYFLLSMTWRMQKFKGSMMRGPGQQGERRSGGMGRGMRN